MSEPKTRKQENAYHKYLTMVAEALDEQGHTMQDVVKAIRRAEIRPTKMAMKEVAWKPLVKVLFGHDSTTKLEKHEVDRVYETMNAWLGREFQLHIPFPSDTPTIEEQMEHWGMN